MLPISDLQKQIMRERLLITNMRISEKPEIITNVVTDCSDRIRSLKKKNNIKKGPDFSIMQK
jgi:hypothetical protein